MPTAAFHSLFWEDQGIPDEPGKLLTAMSKILGPPVAVSIALLLFSAGALF